jgi:hypothetical protein
MGRLDCIWIVYTCFFLYLYCRCRFSYQKRVRWDPINHIFYASPKPRPGFPMSYVVVGQLRSGADPGFQVRGGALKKIAPSGGRRENF